MYNLQTLLIEHRSTVHANERPFKCPVDKCGKSYKSKLTLQMHARVHTGFRPYKCKTCPKGYYFNFNFKMCNVFMGNSLN